MLRMVVMGAVCYRIEEDGKCIGTAWKVDDCYRYVLHGVYWLGSKPSYIGTRSVASADSLADIKHLVADALENLKTQERPKRRAADTQSIAPESDAQIKAAKRMLYLSLMHPGELSEPDAMLKELLGKDPAVREMLGKK